MGLNTLSIPKTVLTGHLRTTPEGFRGSVRVAGVSTSIEMVPSMVDPQGRRTYAVFGAPPGELFGALLGRITEIGDRENGVYTHFEGGLSFKAGILFVQGQRTVDGPQTGLELVGAPLRGLYQNPLKDLRPLSKANSEGRAL